MRSACLSWPLLFGLYLLFAGQLTGPEFAASALLATVAAALVAFLRWHGRAGMRARAPWGRLAFRIGLALTRDSAKVGTALVRALAGQAVRGFVQKQPLDPGGNDDAVAIARRGLVILFGSVAPNGFVLDLEQGVTQSGTQNGAEKRGALVLHRLAPEQRARDATWPV